MKITILGDSSILPRGKGAGNVPYEATYPCLLDDWLRDEFGKSAPKVFGLGMRYRTMEDVVREWEEEVELKDAHLVIIHVGGSDCAPRIFLPWEKTLISLLPCRRLKHTILRAEWKYRRVLLKLLPKRVYVPLRRFAENVEKIVELATIQGRCLIFINIIHTSDHMAFGLPGFRENIANYNRVLGNVADGRSIVTIDLNTLVREGGGAKFWTVDGSHPNPAAHLFVLNALKPHILRVVEEQSNPSPKTDLHTENANLTEPIRAETDRAIPHH